MAISEVLLIGGAAGVGKTSVGWEVYVQTASVAGQHLVREALGDVAITGVLLTAAEPTRVERLVEREIGTDLQRHIDHGATIAEWLATQAPPWVRRLATDGETVPVLAADVIDHSGWTR